MALSKAAKAKEPFGGVYVVITLDDAGIFHNLEYYDSKEEAFACAEDGDYICVATPISRVKASKIEEPV